LRDPAGATHGGPIQALRAGAARIGAGDLGQRISIKTGDELESLADQFNEMGARLRNLMPTWKTRSSGGYRCGSYSSRRRPRKCSSNQPVGL
jgi:hypothetical protein